MDLFSSQDSKCEEQLKPMGLNQLKLPPAEYDSSSCSTFLPTLSIINDINLAIMVGDKRCGESFHMLIGHLDVPFCEVGLHIICLFKNCIVFFLLICRSYKYILDTIFWSYMYIANIISYSVTCFSIC